MHLTGQQTESAGQAAIPAGAWSSFQWGGVRAGSSCYSAPWLKSTMTETRKIAAILAADVVGYSRLAGADEDRTLARLRALRSDLIDPTMASTTAVSSSARATDLSSNSAA